MYIVPPLASTHNRSIICVDLTSTLELRNSAYGLQCRRVGWCRSSIIKVCTSASLSHWSLGTWVLPDLPVFVVLSGGTRVFLQNQNTTNKCSHSLLGKRPKQYNAEIPSDA